ncbi:hypothetical protein lerEdw1_003049 [Lerista edwardsae]|nr:hypothetical protein lerEdw1_003049 [Lerista edwardsae]
MDRLDSRSFLLVLVCMLGALAQEDLKGKAFIFPTSSNTSHVLVRARPRQPLTSFTVCLRVYTDMSHPGTFFSYATSATDNDIVLFQPKSSIYHLYVGNEFIDFFFLEKMDSRPRWEHICMSWESATGLVEFWLDGVRWPRYGMMKGYSVSAEASIVLGQDQDVTGGGFELSQSYVGELTDVYMWDRVLSPKEVRHVQNGTVVSDSLINWRAFNCDIRDYVIVKPALIPV